jgi:predicted  nucleic acid-binding Zn-ribbon protein
MKLQYRILGQLKRVDEKIHRLQSDLDKIPQNLKELDEKLEASKAAFNLAKTNFEGNDKQHRKAEQDVKEKEDFIKKAEAKLMECKTNEEYKAAQKEIDNYKAEKTRLEETALSLLTGVESHKKSLKDAEAKLKEIETLIQQDKKEFEEARTKLLQLFEEQSGQKTSILSQLAPEVATLYHRVATTLKGRFPTIVLAENCSCLGCNMKVRAQLFNEILGAKIIHRCPNCGRILITGTHEVDENLPKEPSV